MDNTQLKYNSEKADNAKYSKIKLPWFSRLYDTRPGNEAGIFYSTFEPIWSSSSSSVNTGSPALDVQSVMTMQRILHTTMIQSKTTITNTKTTVFMWKGCTISGSGKKHT